MNWRERDIFIQMARLNKRGVSIMIGYVLLISIAIIISILVYQWLRTYVPTDPVKCDEGVAIFVKNITYDCTTDNENLNITIKNTGRFSIRGYYIFATNISSDQIATIDLSGYIDEAESIGHNESGVVYWPGNQNENSVNQGDERTDVFDLSASGLGGTLKAVEITPLRYQIINNRIRAINCGGSFVKEVLSCSS